MKLTFKKKFNQWIFKSYIVTPEGLALYRIFVSLFILFFLIPGKGIDHFKYLSSLNSDFFNPPPGPMMFLDHFPPFWIFLMIYVLIILFLVCMLLGYKTKVASITTGLILLALQGLIFSVGKINHEILVPLVPIIMAFSNWGSRFSLDATLSKSKSSINSWPLVLLSLFIAFMMMTAGFPKILGGWLDPTTHAVQGHILKQYFVHNRVAYLSGYSLSFSNPILWELADWATIFFEMGFIFAVWKPKSFQAFVMLAVGFHFSVQLLMNIAFLPNFLGYAAFLNWGRIYNFVYDNARRFMGPKWTPAQIVTALSIFIIVIFSLIKWISVQNTFFSSSDLMLHESIFLFSALLIVFFILIKSFTKKSEMNCEKIREN